MSSDFESGCLVGVAVVLISIATTVGLLVLYGGDEADSPAYGFSNFDGVICLQVDGDYVSCNWDEWRR